MCGRCFRLIRVVGGGVLKKHNVQPQCFHLGFVLDYLRLLVDQRAFI